MKRIHGFSLMEVLVALGIFVIGFVAIASIFPSAALLQRRAADDTRTRQFGQSLEAIISADPATDSDKASNGADLYDGGSTYHDGTMHRITDRLNPSTGERIWSDHTLSYPSHVTDINHRPFVAEVFVRDDAMDENDPVWNGFAFILDARQNSPSVESIVVQDVEDVGTPPRKRRFVIDNDPQRLRVNQWLASDHGKVYRVVSADDTGVVVENDIQFIDHDNDPLTPSEPPAVIWTGSDDGNGNNTLLHVIGPMLNAVRFQ